MPRGELERIDAAQRAVTHRHGVALERLMADGTAHGRPLPDGTTASGHVFQGPDATAQRVAFILEAGADGGEEGFPFLRAGGLAVIGVQLQGLDGEDEVGHLVLQAAHPALERSRILRGHLLGPRELAGDFPLEGPQGSEIPLTVGLLEAQEEGVGGIPPGLLDPVRVAGHGCGAVHALEFLLARLAEFRAGSGFLADVAVGAEFGLGRCCRRPVLGGAAAGGLELHEPVAQAQAFFDDAPQGLVLGEFEPGHPLGHFRPPRRKLRQLALQLGALGLHGLAFRIGRRRQGRLRWSQPRIVGSRSPGSDWLWLWLGIVAEERGGRGHTGVGHHRGLCLPILGRGRRRGSCVHAWPAGAGRRATRFGTPECLADVGQTGGEDRMQRDGAPRNTPGDGLAWRSKSQARRRAMCWATSRRRGSETVASGSASQRSMMPVMKATLSWARRTGSSPGRSRPRSAARRYTRSNLVLKSSQEAWMRARAGANSATYSQREFMIWKTSRASGSLSIPVRMRNRAAPMASRGSSRFSSSRLSST